MALIFETENFIVETFDKPHIDREEGGYIRIYPKKEIINRTKLSPQLAVEFIRLSMITGEALEIGMIKRGLDIVRVNYHDMGNWAFKKDKQPFFHIHIYGRVKNAKYQPYQEAVYLPDRSTGFYNNFKPLNEDDIKEIKKQIEIIFQQDKYKDSNWGLS